MVVELLETGVEQVYHWYAKLAGELLQEPEVRDTVFVRFTKVQLLGT
jgi:hypothetical protein